MKSSKKSSERASSVPSGTLVEVYRNLHKKGVWYSVRDVKSKRVIAHVQWLFLQSVEFHVSPAGNARVRKEKRKNVHALIRGRVTENINRTMKLRKIYYDPYKMKQFHYWTFFGLKEIYFTERNVMFTPHGVFADFA